MRPPRLAAGGPVTFLPTVRPSSHAQAETALSSRPQSSVVRLAPARRRIWELDASRVALIAGGLLGRDEVSGILPASAGLDGEAELVLGQVVRACAHRGSIAEAVEAALHERSGWLAALVDGSPMIELAGWWSGHREELTAAQLASFLWRLSCDPRPLLEKLASRVAEDLCLRAMQLLRDHQSRVDARVPRSVPTSCARAIV